MFLSRKPLSVESPRRMVCALLSLTLLLAFSAPCSAEPSDSPASGPARELWLEGKQLAESGEYEKAIDRFDRAYEIEHTPALGLWVARTLARAGRLLEASDRYRALSQQSLPPDAGARDWAAKRDAESERRQLLPRIPSVVVVVDGANKEEVSVTLNGQPLPANAIGVSRMVDPGPVQVRGKRAELLAETSVKISEGELKTVRLSFRPPPPPVAPAPRPALSRKPKAATELNQARDSASSGDGRRVLAYVSVGVGGAALLTGAVFGLLAVDDESRLQNECPGSRCRSALSSDVEVYESRKTVAMVSLLAGAAVTATGVVLYLTAPREPRVGRVGVYVLGSSAGLRGAF
jgi:hypothetical protein